MTPDLLRLAKMTGILTEYQDFADVTRGISAETAHALLKVLGHTTESPEAIRTEIARITADRARRCLPTWHVEIEGTRPTVPISPQQTWSLRLEHGAEFEGRGKHGLPTLPLGVHRLKSDGSVCWLLAAPASLPLPRRGWGVMVPLAGLADPERGGLGDYGDLENLISSVDNLKAGFVGINPIHAGFPYDSNNYSPYSPSHRRRFNVIHIPVDTPESPGLLIDYAAEIPRRIHALRAAFESQEAAGANPDFEAFLRQGGPSLARFALHQALSQRHGSYWRDWPGPLRDVAQAESLPIDPNLAVDIRFHAWAQWRAEGALARIAARAQHQGMAQGLYLDLAVGTHPFGAETWEDPESFAAGVSLGAPPDPFAPQGQSWGLAPFDPSVLVASGFRPLAETLRRQLRHAGMLRIDHILGFDRAFWVPTDGTPGAYVSMPLAAMLAVARIEAARAGAVIVGEDLGNVSKALRKHLADSGILGCRVAMFERDWTGDKGFLDPATYPEASIASFSTHDLPTWQGWRRGTDLDLRAKLGLIDADTRDRDQATRRTDVAAFDKLTQGGPNADDLHRVLARAGSCLTAVQIETALGLHDQPNLPGTIDSYPNWRHRLPYPAKQLAEAPALCSAAQIMARSGRGEGLPTATPE